MHKTKTLVTLFVALLLGLVSQDGWSQADNTLARVYQVKPLQGHGAQLEAAIQKHAAWRKQQGDPWTWGVYQVVNGDNLGNFIIRSGNHTWADFDAYDAGFEVKGNAQWNADVVPHIESITSTITEGDADHTRLPEDMSVFNLFSVTTYHMKPGHGEDFTQAISKFHDAVVKTNYPVHYAFISTVNGGEGPTNTLVIPHENWASFQGPDKSLGALMGEVYGDFAGDVFEQFSSSYSSTESAVILLRRDLSVLPDM